MQIGSKVMMRRWICYPEKNWAAAKCWCGKVHKRQLWMANTSLGTRFPIWASQARLEIHTGHIPDDSTALSLIPWLCWLPTTSERCCRHFLVGLCHWSEISVHVKSGRDPYHPCTTDVCRWWARQWCLRELHCLGLWSHKLSRVGPVCFWMGT